MYYDISTLGEVITVRFSASAPIYLQVMDHIKRAIVSGGLRPGERVESVRALAARYGINLNTMQRACAELEREGLIETRRGVGSFVTEDAARLAALRERLAAELTEEFLARMAALGFTRAETAARLEKEGEQ